MLLKLSSKNSFEVVARVELNEFEVPLPFDTSVIDVSVRVL